MEDIIDLLIVPENDVEFEPLCYVNGHLTSDTSEGNRSLYEDHLLVENKSKIYTLFKNLKGYVEENGLQIWEHADLISFTKFVT